MSTETRRLGRMDSTQINVKFVESFGELERLCNQIYSDKHGVTSYIDDMRKQTGGGIADWNSTCRRLVEVRHKRNNLSHGEVSFQEPYATQADIQFIIEFRQSILDRTDPLAQLKKLKQARLRAARGKKRNRRGAAKSRRWVGMVACVLLVLCVGLCLWLGWR